MPRRSEDPSNDSSSGGSSFVSEGFSGQESWKGTEEEDGEWEVNLEEIL